MRFVGLEVEMGCRPPHIQGDLQNNLLASFPLDQKGFEKTDIGVSVVVASSIDLAITGGNAAKSQFKILQGWPIWTTVLVKYAALSNESRCALEVFLDEYSPRLRGPVCWHLTGSLTTR